MGNLGVFEAEANAGKLSAEAAANNGFELERAIDTAIFRAKERFGAYLANAQSKSDLEERWAEVKPQVLKLIAEVTAPTPRVVRRVGRALEPTLSSRAATAPARPSAKAVGTEKERREAANAHRDDIVPGSGVAIKPKDFTRVGATQKHAWSYSQETKLYTSNNPMQKFACPGCGTEQAHLGFTKCACGRQWNSWPVRQMGTDKTSASTYVLMAREIKMRGDQFKMASASNVKVADAPMPQQPNFGTMPGDNSAAMGAPAAPMAGPAPQGPPGGPMPGDADHDGDVAGGITEGSPIDQIQDALEGAVMALKDVQMLSINPVLAKTASAKVDTLRTAMDRFWGLHKQMNYVAGELAREANEALRATDPRITAEAEFVKGYEAAAKNEPLPAKTGRAYLEGYISFHKQAETTPVDADYGPAKGVSMDHLTESEGRDTTNGTRNDGSFLAGGGLDDAANTLDSDAGPFDASQPAQREFASQMDADNAAGKSRGDQGESSTIQPTGARKAAPKGGK